MSQRCSLWGVDGNDAWAIYNSVKAARKMAITEQKPTPTEKVVLEGGVDGLLSYLENLKMRFTTTALSTLEVLADLESGRGCLLSNTFCSCFSEMVFRVSDPQASEVYVRLLFYVLSH